MVVIAVIAGLAGLVNVVSYLRSPDFWLRRWTKRWGINHYTAYAFAESAGVRIRPVDSLGMQSVRRLATFRAAWVTLLFGGVAVLMLQVGASVVRGSLVLWLLALVQVSPHLVVEQAMQGVRAKQLATALRGAACAAGGWLLLLLGIAGVWWAALSQEAGYAVRSWLLAMCAGLAVMALSVQVLEVARRVLSRTVPARFGFGVGLHDTLFLRSFNDDAMRLRSADPAVGSLGVFAGLTVRFEELMAELIAKETPLVAIGKPGEPLPALGAVRTYVADDEWQLAVEQTSKRVGSIVLVAGVTGGLEWELKHLRDWGLAQKVTVLLPPVDESQAWNRLHRVLSQLGIDFGVVEDAKETGSWLGVLLRTVTAIGIDDEGQACFYVSDRRDWISYSATIVLSQQIVRGEKMPPEHGAIAEFLDLDVRDSVLAPVAGLAHDLLSLTTVDGEARGAVQDAVTDADGAEVRAEHLLVTLLSGDNEATRALVALGVDIDRLRHDAQRLRDEVRPS